MRVTAATKEANRKKILETAEKQFRTSGFEATTTRDIAIEAGIAVGTLFNYFPTKEAIVTQLIIDALHGLETDFRAEAHASLEESLFAHATAGMRLLKPYRKYLTPVLESALSALPQKGVRPLATVDQLEHRVQRKRVRPRFEAKPALSPVLASNRNDMGDLLRTDHLETVVELARLHHLESAMTPMALQMYWTLYLGTLSFWTGDKSSKQEDTLALLDQSMAMFAGWVSSTKDTDSSSH